MSIRYAPVANRYDDNSGSNSSLSSGALEMTSLNTPQSENEDGTGIYMVIMRCCNE